MVSVETIRAELRRLLRAEKRAAAAGLMDPDLDGLPYERRLRTLRKIPVMRALEAKLLALGGRRVALRPDSYADAIVKHGKAVRGANALGVRRELNRCHGNVARLWLARHRRGFQIATGWALNEDGIWRQHSWGLQGDRLIETTVNNDLYFGVTLNLTESVKFCLDNAGDEVDAGRSRLMRADPEFRAVMLEVANLYPGTRVGRPVGE